MRLNAITLNCHDNPPRAGLAHGLLKHRHSGREIALNGGTDTPQTIASAIRAYLRRRPHAADTARGVREWWLADHPPGFSREDVEAALAHLATLQIVVAGINPDGRRIWRAGPQLLSDIALDGG